MFFLVSFTEVVQWSSLYYHAMSPEFIAIMKLGGRD